MGETLGNLLEMGLAIASILVVLKSWGNKRLFITRLVAVIVGAGLGVLVMVWPDGLVAGLAAAAIAPYALQRWIHTHPNSAGNQRVEEEELSPPVATKQPVESE